MHGRGESKDGTYRAAAHRARFPDSEHTAQCPQVCSSHPLHRHAARSALMPDRPLDRFRWAGQRCFRFSPLHSSFHCSRRFGASRSLRGVHVSRRSLDPATSDGWCCAHAGACSGRSALTANRLTSMPTQNPRAQIARKVNFAIQLLREAAELLEASPKVTTTRRPRYSQRSTEQSK